MSSSLIFRYLNPWRARRALVQQRIAELRSRDGDTCRRCRRPLRFDLPPGHDQGATVAQLAGDTDAIDTLCLTHVRCNPAGADHTGEVTERMRRRNEAALLSRPRKRAGSRG
jgi:hypothetical protein